MTSKQRAYLKGLAMNIVPVFQIGKSSLTPEITQAVDEALEARELWQESAGETTKLPGVEARDGEREGLPVTTVDILDQEGEKALGKPKGRYVTLTLEGLASREGDIFARSIQALAAELSLLLKDIPPQGLVLVAGLGNPSRVRVT